MGNACQSQHPVRPPVRKPVSHGRMTSRSLNRVRDSDRDGNNTVDRISSLPEEVLGKILSYLPTKDAAALCVLSRTMRRAFSLSTSIDLDDSRIFHCLARPKLIERFPTFETFVESVLQAYNDQQHSIHLDRFRLRLGGDHRSRVLSRLMHTCGKGCFPDLNTKLLNACLCFPLIRKVREIDLSIHVRKPGSYCKLPPPLFASETLQVLKLDTNLYMDEVSVMRSFCLPNLKVFHLHTFVIPDGGFVNRLISKCPSLEDLVVEHCWLDFKNVDMITISSPSLQRLVLNMESTACYLVPVNQHRNISHIRYHYLHCVLIDTPNLQRFHYVDNLAFNYSLPNMNALVDAEIDILKNLNTENYKESSFRSMLSFVKTLSNVQKLVLSSTSLEALDFGGLKDQLPVFHNLKYLELLGGSNKWDKVLLEFLNCSPILETLTFPVGFSTPGFPHVDPERMLAVELEEARCWSTSRATPLCCRSHLKRIVIRSYWCSRRDLNLVKFFLEIALVLEELVIFWGNGVIPPPNVDETPDRTSLERMLKKLPSASTTCSIRVV